jgi:hypothetical protein
MYSCLENKDTPLRETEWYRNDIRNFSELWIEDINNDNPENIDEYKVRFINKWTDLDENSLDRELFEEQLNRSQILKYMIEVWYIEGEFWDRIELSEDEYLNMDFWEFVKLYYEAFLKELLYDTDI